MGGEITYFRTKHFDRSLNEAKLGGQSRKKATKVCAVLGSLGDPNPFHGLAVTHNGETRLEKCVKYDLGDGWRLVTVQDSRTCGFVYVGSHDAVDRFLDAHRGTRFGVHDGKIVVVPGAGLHEEQGRAGLAAGPAHRLTELLGTDDEYVLSELPPKAFRRIDALDTQCTPDELSAAVAEIPDEKRRAFVLDVLSLVLAGNADGWRARIAYERGEITDSDAVDADRVITVEDGDEIRSIIVGSPEYERYIADLERTSTWHDWFLYLHPEQEKVVKAEYDGPAQLSGVSGSGKTCVLVRRAIRLADRPDARVLLVTLNRSLAGLLAKLVDAACAQTEVRRRITVRSYFDLARDLLLERDPSAARSLEERTWKLAEHVDEIFREYFRCWANFDQAKVLRPLQRQLTARGICGEDYLREELDWIRSALSVSQRAEYLHIERSGRRVPIPEDRRRDVLAGLAGWEHKMEVVGVVDYLGLSNALCAQLDHLQPRFDHILVDEAQDFGTTEMTVLRRLAAAGPNDLFLCGDVAQTVLPKHRSLSRAGISLVRRERILQNYRNSREILRAAYDLLVNNLDEDLFEDDGLELLDPKFANFSSAAPVALSAASLEEEIGYARSYARSRLKAGVKSVCIALAGFTARDVEAFARRCGSEALNGLYDPRETPLVFSDLEQTKGYEFETLIIVNCREGILPAVGAPPEEAFRQACKLYVAMTRARRELVLSYSGDASPWLKAVSDTIGAEEWSACEELDIGLMGGVPEALPEAEEEEDTGSSLAGLTGLEYLYAGAALGLSLEAQEKLGELVDGDGLVSASGRRLRWRTVSDLATDLTSTRLYDLRFGPRVSDELRHNLAQAFPPHRPQRIESRPLEQLS